MSLAETSLTEVSQGHRSVWTHNRKLCFHVCCFLWVLALFVRLFGPLFLLTWNQGMINCSLTICLLVCLFLFRWVFFQEEDMPCLYPVYAHSLDPIFEVKVTEPDLEAYPLLSLVHPMECILNAGTVVASPTVLYENDGGAVHSLNVLDLILSRHVRTSLLRHIRTSLLKYSKTSLLRHSRISLSRPSESLCCKTPC